MNQNSKAIEKVAHYEISQRTSWQQNNRIKVAVHHFVSESIDFMVAIKVIKIVMDRFSTMGCFFW